MSRQPAVVIAVGNAWRGDDAAGIEVARLVEQRLPAGVELVHTRGDASTIMELWQDRELAVIVDAVCGGAPGEVLEIDALVSGLPAGLASASTHDFGLAQALELGRLMDNLPARLQFIGIAGQCFGVGDAFSEPVRGALGDAAERVIRALSGQYRASGFQGSRPAQ